MAKIYQSHLEISKKVAEEEGVTVKAALLDGKPFEKVLQYIRRENPWLLVVGRIGVHSDEDMDIGSNSENLLRLAPCNVLVSSRKFVPPIDAIAEYTVAWTEEANKRMERVPSFARGMAKTAVYRYAIEKGHTIISNAVVDAAMGDILPKGAIEAMKNLGKTLDEKGIDRDKMLASDDVAESLVSRTLSGMVAQVADTSAEPKQLDYYLCEGCGYTAKGAQPVQCPICNVGGEKFKRMDKSIFEAAAKAEGGIETEEAYDGIQLKWTDEARKLIRTVPPGFIRRRAKAKIDKLARKKGIETITREFASPMIEEELAYVKVQQGGNGKAEDHPSGGFSWTPEARQRVERVPEGFMRDCTQGLIEKHAKTIGASTITLEIANQGIEEGKRTMEEAMRNPELLNEIMAKLKVSKGETKNP
ncbi:MAG TPA: universal stress protein [Bacteroidota bacterium]|nr:universal stress protein [Bacteroidota bacterium]